MYTTILHPLRKAYNLSIHEYCILDSIYMLSHNKKYGGWCVMSKRDIGKELDLSERTVFVTIDLLEAKGLIDKSEKGFLRTTDEWNELIANKHDYFIAFNGKEGKMVSGKLHLHGQITPSMQHSAEGMQKLQGRYAETAVGGMQKLQSIIDIDNNKINKRARPPREHLKSFSEEKGVVQLSLVEYRKLCQQIGRATVKEYIKSVEDWKLKSEKNFKMYDNDYRIILSWVRKAKGEGKLKISWQSFEEEDFDSKQDYENIINKYQI